MAGHGGARKNAGRKTKADEQKVNEIMLTALKRLHKVDEDEEAKIKFIQDLYESQRGQIFIAEHLFGKPKETVDTKLTLNNVSLKDLVKFDSPKQ